MVLINDAPGSGKSTIAQLLTQGRGMALPIDVDALKHSLGYWDNDPLASGLHARLLCLALVAAHLGAGHDVVVAQYLARTSFIEDLEASTKLHQARFCEFILQVDVPTLAQRLAVRAVAPDRAEHKVNNLLVGPADAGRLGASARTPAWGRLGGRPGDSRCNADPPARCTRALSLFTTVVLPAH